MKSCNKIIKTLMIATFVFSISYCLAKSPEQSSSASLRCEAKSTFFSYTDNSSYIKDVHSHAKELYSEKFIIDFPAPDRATKKHINDMVEDEDYSVIKTGSLYRLKLLKGTDDVSVVIDLKTGNYSSVSEKHDVMIRIKAKGTCEKHQ